jgi:hypothetical protein
LADCLPHGLLEPLLGPAGVLDVQGDLAGRYPDRLISRRRSPFP